MLYTLWTTSSLNISFPLSCVLIYLVCCWFCSVLRPTGVSYLHERQCSYFCRHRQLTNGCITRKITSPPQVAINCQQFFREGRSFTSPSLSCSQMCRAPSSLAQVPCSNHSYYRFMSETVMSCLEDSVMQHFSPFSGSYIPSVPSNDSVP